MPPALVLTYLLPDRQGQRPGRPRVSVQLPMSMLLCTHCLGGVFRAAVTRYVRLVIHGRTEAFIVVASATAEAVGIRGGTREATES